MSLQEAMKLLRLELGITQEDLARKMNKAFVTVNRWENGKGFPSRNNAKMLLEVAREGHASDYCLSYLNEVLLPDSKRTQSAATYGFPDIDREFLFQLADSSTNCLYVIEDGTYRLLYLNRCAEKMGAKHLAELGFAGEERKLVNMKDKRCHYYFNNLDEPCENCPLKQFQLESFTDTVYIDSRTLRKVKIHARKTQMKGRNVYIIYLTDITQEEAELNALYELTNDIPEGVGIYHYYMDDHVELAFMNHALFSMIGEERGKELRRKGSLDVCLIHPQDKPLLITEIHNSIAEKRNAVVCLRMRVAENQYQWIQLSARMIKRGKERLTYYCVLKKIDHNI